MEDLKQIIEKLLEKLVKIGFSEEIKNFEIEEKEDGMVSIIFHEVIFREIKSCYEKCGETLSSIHFGDHNDLSVNYGHMFFVNFVLKIIKDDREKEMRRIRKSEELRKYKRSLIERIITEKIKKEDAGSIKVHVRYNKNKDVHIVKLIRKSREKGAYSFRYEYLDGRSKRSLERCIEEFVHLINTLKKQ